MTPPTDRQQRRDAQCRAVRSLFHVALAPQPGTPIYVGRPALAMVHGHRAALCVVSWRDADGDTVAGTIAVAA